MTSRLLLSAVLLTALALTGCDTQELASTPDAYGIPGAPQADASFLARNTLVSFENDAFTLYGEEDVSVVIRDGELEEAITIGHDEYIAPDGTELLIVDYEVEYHCAVFEDDGRTVRLEGNYSESNSDLYPVGDPVIATFLDGARGRDGGVGPIPLTEANFPDVSVGDHCSDDAFVPLATLKAAAEANLGACNLEYATDPDYCLLDRGNNQTRINGRPPRP